MTYRSYLIAVGLALAAAAAAAALYFFFPNAPFARTALGISPLFISGSPVAPAGASLTASSTPLSPPRTPPAGEFEYRSAAYRFSLFYPSNLKTSSYDEGSGAATLVFEDPAQAQGFQIFVVPYTAPQVNAARFAEDEPSGVRDNLENMTVDGADAAAFYGQDATLGPTREVWFIHGGYLFEVTAPKQDASWLDVIVATWQFI